MRKSISLPLLESLDLLLSVANVFRPLLLSQSPTNNFLLLHFSDRLTESQLLSESLEPTLPLLTTVFPFLDLLESLPLNLYLPLLLVNSHPISLPSESLHIAFHLPLQFGQPGLRLSPSPSFGLVIDLPNFYVAL